jgi:hypothetical protein
MKKAKSLKYNLPEDAIWEPLYLQQEDQGVRSIDELAFSHRAVFDAKALIPVIPETKKAHATGVSGIAQAE